MSNPNRLSASYTTTNRRGSITSLDISAPSPSTGDTDQWISDWRAVLARDLLDSKLVEIDETVAVEEACETLLKHRMPFLTIRSTGHSASEGPYIGLFDFSDVNAFLTLAATRHQLSSEYLSENPKVDQILQAAIAGKVPVQLVSNLSEKNPLITVPYGATVIDLLRVFSSGVHRCLLSSNSDPTTPYLGYVSDNQLLRWFQSYAARTPSFHDYLSTGTVSNTSTSPLPYFTGVVSCDSDDTVLTSMKKMSEEGVSSVAVLNAASGGILLSAVSVTDVGNLVVPSPDNHILTEPLHQFIAQIKHPDGSTDGVDKYPVYAVGPTSRLSYTIEKILATNAHRLFVSNDMPSPGGGSHLTGVVSIVDILSLFARLAKIPNVDPGHMRHHRRASSASSHSKSPTSARSRSSSRASYGSNSKNGDNPRSPRAP